MQTPRYGHEPVEMRMFDKTGFWDRPDIRVGDFYWGQDDEGRRSLWVMIPDRTGRPHGVASCWSIDHRNDCGAQWGWNGNEPAPTLTPSLHAIGVWHGFVANGKLIEA